MLKRLWNWLVKVETPFHVELGLALRSHGAKVAAEHHHYLATQYEKNRVQNEQDFNIVNDTRQRMIAINRERNAKK